MAENRGLSPIILALGAIALWGTLAALALQLAAVPPFLLTGIALAIGALVGARALVHRPPPLAAIALGACGLFGFHFFLFLALRNAPPVEANLINYLWPLLIVAMAPLFVPGITPSARHLVAAVLGFAGAALLIGGGAQASGRFDHPGYAFAAISAFIWASYSLLTRRFRHFPTAYVSWFCLVSGVASLACHFALEPRYVPSAREWPWLVALGVGPMGAAFFLWDRALKKGDPRVIGNLAYITPLLSTLVLVAIGAGTLTGYTVAGMAMILASAWLGSARTSP
jgi:drug/metabolite transporter (DMT)-like permease